jgi:peroxiredoxin Q/BCP
MAPAFDLPGDGGVSLRLADYRGRKVVLYFYPKDDTSGCTVEACEFRDTLPKFAGAKVVGVSPDSVASHQKFIKKFDLNFTLLADVDKALAEACGVWVEKSMYGKKYMGVARTTFLLDEEGIVRRVWTQVKPAGHAADVLAALS